MKYSSVNGGIVVGLLGVLLATQFSESCSNELIQKLLPFAGALPGLITAWLSHHKLGGTTPLGFKK